jgi:hypothetical protein
MVKRPYCRGSPTPIATVLSARPPMFAARLTITECGVKELRQLRLPSLPQDPSSRSNPSGGARVIYAQGLGSVEKLTKRTTVRGNIPRRRGLCAIRRLARAQERLDEVHGQREHDGGFLTAELEHGLEVAQLKGGGLRLRICAAS